MSELAQLVTRIRQKDLVGKAVDVDKVLSIVQECELVVAHNAWFDRQFLEPLIPILEHLPWACSLTDIDWLGKEQQVEGSICHLLSLHCLESIGTPIQDCLALASALERPLPVSMCTGFAALLRAAHEPQLRFWVPNSGVSDRVALLRLGFEYVAEADAWRLFASGERASRLQSEVVDTAVYEGGFSRFEVAEVEAKDRFSVRSLIRIEPQR